MTFKVWVLEWFVLRHVEWVAESRNGGCFGVADEIHVDGFQPGVSFDVGRPVGSAQAFAHVFPQKRSDEVLAVFRDGDLVGEDQVLTPEDVSEGFVLRLAFEWSVSV